MPITVAGIGSGLDLQAVIDVYVKGQKEPKEELLNIRKEELNIELSALSNLKSTLNSFSNAAKSLSEPDKLLQKKVTIENDDNSFEVITANGTNISNFDLEVEELATGTVVESKLYTNAQVNFGPGSLTFTAQSSGFTIDVDSSDSLVDIRDKVNSSPDNFGVVANIINTENGSKIVYSSSLTGTSNNLLVMAQGDNPLAPAPNKLLKMAQNANKTDATDALININGTQITSSTNLFVDPVLGIDIRVNKVTSSPKNVDIADDTQAFKDKITNFMEQYNGMMDILDELSNPETGDLAFDPTIRNIKSQLSNTLASIVDVNGSFSSLYEIGIEVTRDNRLEFGEYSQATGLSGEQKLDNALNNEFSKVVDLFSKNDGYATEIVNSLDDYLDTQGTLKNRTNQINSSLEDIEKDREDLYERVEAYETSLINRYAYVDATVAQYNAIGEALKTSLANLPSNNKN